MVWPTFPGFVAIYPEGKVVYRQKVWGRLSQLLKLRDFSLDRQFLRIHIVAVCLLQQEVKMVPMEPEEAGIASQFSVPEFDGSPGR